MNLTLQGGPQDGRVIPNIDPGAANKLIFPRITPEGDTSRIWSDEYTTGGVYIRSRKDATFRDLEESHFRYLMGLISGDIE